MSTSGWVGKTVRHWDGRTGRIDSEYTGFLHLALSISVDNGGTGYVQLNTNGPDTGDSGWEWWCENFDGGPTYLPLGDWKDPS